jgi:hypothetical protein
MRRSIASGIAILIPRFARNMVREMRNDSAIAPVDPCSNDVHEVHGETLRAALAAQESQMKIGSSGNRVGDFGAIWNSGSVPTEDLQAQILGGSGEAICIPRSPRWLGRSGHANTFGVSSALENHKRPISTSTYRRFTPSIYPHDFPKTLKIGVAGTGRMGTAIARRLIEAGHEVRVWNRTADNARDAGEAGAKWTMTLGELARDSESEDKACFR